MDDLQQTTPTVTASGTMASAWREPAGFRLLCLLRRRGALLLAGSVIPAVLAVVLLEALPRQYTATLAYERPLAESEYSVLLRRFYSQENLGRIMKELQQQGLVQFARRLEKARTERSIERLIRFEPSPSYPVRLRTTDPETSERIGTLLAQLVLIRVTGKAAEEAAAAAAVVRGNFEDVLPIYEVRKRLKDSVQQFKNLAAEIEDGRFLLQVELQKEQARLEKLRGVEGAAPGEVQGVILQFNDVQNSREFLPLSYQIRATESTIIDLKETQNANTEKFDYYLQVLELSDVLLDKAESSLLTAYTMPQLLDFLGEQLSACQNDAVADYLKSYIRRTENLVLINTRAGERPVVYPVSRHLVMTAALTFVVGLMVSAFVAVLLESWRQRRRAVPASAVEPAP